MKDIFIGIDGGATKTKVRIENAKGEVLGQSLQGPANIQLSVDQAWQSILQGVAEALKPFGMRLGESASYRFHVGMGLAGCEIQSAYEAFIDHPHSFYTLQVVSDAHTACLGAHQGQDGSVIILGTGALGYQIEKGQSTRVGGWGFPHDDLGGGADLGFQAVRKTFQWLDNRIEPSPLLKEIFTFFNENFNYLVSWANRANSTEYARFASLVIDHAKQHDPIAIKIMKKAASATERIFKTLLKFQTQKDRSLPCALMGGVAPFVEPWLSDEVRLYMRPSMGDATVGALLMIRERLAHA